MSKKEIVKAEDCVTGVHCGHDIEEMWDQNDIDLDWEDYVEQAKEALKKKNWSWFKENCDDEPEVDTEEEAQEIIDNLGDYNICFDGGDTRLYGSWKKNAEGEYEPDKTGDADYAAIFNVNHNTIQVVWSKHVISCRRCSPCYPGQGNVDSPPGGGYAELWAFCLPPDLMLDEWVKKNKKRIVELKA